MAAGLNFIKVVKSRTKKLFSKMNMEKIPLRDDDSHAFMKKKGFENIQGEDNCYDSTWRSSGFPIITLKFPHTKLIRNDKDFHAAIYYAGYVAGTSNGQDQVIKNLRKKTENFLENLLQ